jgi:hypothetical protein
MASVGSERWMISGAKVGTAIHTGIQESKKVVRT